MPIEPFGAEDLGALFEDMGVAVHYPAGGVDLERGALVDRTDQLELQGEVVSVVGASTVLTIVTGSLPGLREGEVLRVADEWLSVIEGPLRIGDGALSLVACRETAAPEG